MTFDDDIRKQFDQMSPQIDDLDAGAAAAQQSAHRRSTATRVALGGAAIVALLIGFVTISNLNDDQTEVRTADPNPTVAPDPTPGTTPDTIPGTIPGTTTPGELSTTGIATVDVNGVVRLNGEIVDAETWLPRLEAAAAESAVGPDGQILITEEIDGCTRISIVDGEGTPLDDHPVSSLSRCIAGEIAEWSSAGHVVLVAPTAEDAWTLTVLSVDGEAAQITSPGAFQPTQLDVHTDRSGRTQAIVLGTGEELVYVDVDAFLQESPPEIAIRGISNPQNLVSARFVDGIEQHPYQAQVDEVIASNVTVPDTSTEPSSLVWAVSNVAADDTLNARSGPGTAFDIVFEFRPDATGVVRTGDEATSADGAEWFEVFAPTSGTDVDTGWVNSALLVETPVPDGRPCLFNGPQDHYIGFEWTNPDGSPDSDAAVISNIETYRFGGCIRTVIEFSDGWSYEDGGATRVTTLPHDLRVYRQDQVIVDLGRLISGAEVAEARFSESVGVDQSIFMVKDAGPDHVVGYLFSPTTTTTATFDNTNGTVIIDIADIRLTRDADPAAVEQVGAAVEPIVDSNSLVLTRVKSSDAGTRWSVAGFARPFEATLSVGVRTSGGEAIDVEWFGAVAEGQRSENGVTTTTWTEAWGQFGFAISLPDGVEPADVVIVFDPSGGAADDVQTIDLSLADHLG